MRYQIFILLSLLSHFLLSNGREFEIKPLNCQIKIDGNLSEPCWEEAQAIGDLIQREPNPGAFPTERTVIKIFFDSNNLYIGAYCHDSKPQKIVANFMGRDAELRDDDRIEILLDPFLDRRNGFLFVVNPLGAMFDSLISENGSYMNREWDAVWDARAKIVEDGWIAEIAIPFKSLIFNPSNDSWGFNFARFIRRKLEEDRWSSPRLDIRFVQVSEAGVIKGLKGLMQGYGIDVKPYGIVGHSWEKEDNIKKLISDVGADIIYKITPNLTSCLTINTDFAETEVDERRINLTRFPLFFPEKRTFFLEGAGIFSFGEGMGFGFRGIDFLPFFSRTIGLTKDEEENNVTVPIIAGIKLIGKIKDYEIGFLDVLTDRFHEQERKNFLVARIKKPLWSQSYVGAIFTYGNPEGNEKNFLAGFDFRYRTSKFLGDKNFFFLLYGVKTKTEGIRGNDSAFGFSIGYPNDLFEATLSWKQIEENFNPAMGFLYRENIRKAFLSLTYAPRPKIFGIRRIPFELRWNETMDLKNNPLTRFVFISPLNIEFESGEHIEFTIVPQYDYVDKAYEISEGIEIPVGKYRHTRYRLQVETASKRPFSIDIQYWWGGFYGGTNRSPEIGLNYKSGKHIVIGLRYEENNVSIPQGSFKTTILGIRLDYSFNPRLTLFNFLQYDTELDNIGINTRLRWTISPGNDIFFVLNHSWIDYEGEAKRFNSYTNDIRFKIVYTHRL
ncbi:MAG: DUF5916 domain-containing protein [Candidatus Aminicenantia bacterium]